MLLLFFGCSPCDSDALSGASTGADVLAACEVPEVLSSWHASGQQEPPENYPDWSCDAAPLDSPRIGSREIVYAMCGVGEQHDFVYSTGQPYLAVAMQHWADTEGIDADVATPFLDEPIIPPVELPVVEVENPVEPTGEFSTIARDAMASELTHGPLRLAVKNGNDWLHLVELEPGESHKRIWFLEEGAVYTDDGDDWSFQENLERVPIMVEPAIQGGDHLTVEQWLQAALRHQNPVLGAPDRCQEPPAGMVCVPAGLVVSATGPALVPTFYMDARPLDPNDYAKCAEEGFCKDANSQSMSYLRLEEYCTWSGKRVPTEWEWEAGQESGAFDTWGIEWTNTYWHDEDVESVRWDPWGPCGAGYPCAGNTSKVVRGPDRDRRRRARRSDYAGTGRCVVRDPDVIATWPPAHLVKPPEAPWSLTALTDEHREVVAGIRDDAIDEVPICTDRVGLSSLDCKDPVNHVTPNEERYHVVLPYLTNRGGGYVGVASDQNYTFVVEARSEFAWFMDYDAVIVHLHQVARAVFLKADTREEFVSWYDPERSEELEALLDETYPDHPDLEFYKSHVAKFKDRLFKHYTEQMEPNEDWGDRGWLRTPDNYEWIRDLWRTGRARTVKGNMLGENAMKDIGDAARKLGVPIRVYYTSNAPSAWGSEMTPSYKANVRGLPMDNQSIVLQVFGFKTGYGQTGYWHYNIQHGPQQQEHLARHDWLWQVYWPSLPTDDDDVTVSGLPGAPARKPVTRTYVTPSY